MTANLKFAFLNTIFTVNIIIYYYNYVYIFTFKITKYLSMEYDFISLFTNYIEWSLYRNLKIGCVGTYIIIKLKILSW